MSLAGWFSESQLAPWPPKPGQTFIRIRIRISLSYSVLYVHICIYDPTKNYLNLLMN